MLAALVPLSGIAIVAWAVGVHTVALLIGLGSLVAALFTAEHRRRLFSVIERKGVPQLKSGTPLTSLQSILIEHQVDFVLPEPTQITRVYLKSGGLKFHLAQDVSDVERPAFLAAVRDAITRAGGPYLPFESLVYSTVGEPKRLALQPSGEKGYRTREGVLITLLAPDGEVLEQAQLAQDDMANLKVALVSTATPRLGYQVTIGSRVLLTQVPEVLARGLKQALPYYF